MIRENYLKEQFFEVLRNKKIKTVFQPIVSLRDCSVYGYEALSRGPQNHEMENPNILFEYAEKYSKLWELEFLCRTTALESVYDLQTDLKLFLNVNPNIMHDIKFKQGFTLDYLDKFCIDPKRIVFEITEREAINNISDFIKTVENYKAQNFKIAIDDAGAGYSGLNLISDIRPHFIKIDMYLIRGIDKDITKQSIIKSMYEFASLTNTQLIAEGIETEDELKKLIEVGVHFGQGYYIQKPKASISPINPKVIKIINDENIKKNNFFRNGVSDLYISNICIPLRTINSNILVSQVEAMMTSDESITGFCITVEDVPIGVITRNVLYKYISGLYGYNLYSKKPISSIMSKDFLSFDHMTTIDKVAKIAMQRNFDKIYDFITISKDDKYLGIVTVKEMLEALIKIEVLNAKHLNPLSELPGNLLIERELEVSIKSGKYHNIIYFDIDNFKAYNDLYGFENGDMVLKGLTKLLKEFFSQEGFIGHIGGDDFIVITNLAKVDKLCSNIIKMFDELIISFYNQNDIKNGYIVTNNRYGVEESFPLMTISIAVVSSGNHNNIYELAESASKIKKICKEIPGSNYIISR